MVNGTVGAYEGEQYYFHPDHLGSSSFITDTSGEVYEHLEYFPYGETWGHQQSGSTSTPYKFTGKELDEETGLYYYGARYYDPRTSVWVSADPILEDYMPTGDPEMDKKLPGMGGIFNPKNLGMFSYTHNNPINFTDPDGRELAYLELQQPYSMYLSVSPNSERKQILCDRTRLYPTMKFLEAVIELGYEVRYNSSYRTRDEQLALVAVNKRATAGTSGHEGAGANDLSVRKIGSDGPWVELGTVKEIMGMAEERDYSFGGKDARVGQNFKKIDSPHVDFMPPGAEREAKAKENHAQFKRGMPEYHQTNKDPGVF